MCSRSVRRSVCALIVAAVGVFAALAATRARVSAQPSRGKQVYDAHCAECHGDSGGTGPAATFLNPRPRDFTSGK